MKFHSNRFHLKVAACAALLAAVPLGANTPQSLKGLMYVGTLDKKLLVISEQKGDIVGEIALDGIPRTTVLSPDHTKLHIITTQLELLTVDLATKKVVSSFLLSDGKSIPRMVRSAYRNFSGVAVDPGGRYLYTTMKVAVKEIDQYRVDPPIWVKIDLQEKKIAQTYPFPKGYDQGFGFAASYKISPDGKLLYVFDDDIVIFNLSDMQEVDRIPLSKPEYPGASPYRLMVSDDPNDDPGVVTSIFTSVDPIVHKETLGLGKLDLMTHKIDYQPLGPSFPMVGFALSPDRKLGYSMMFTGAGANRRTEWWVWDVESHKVIQKEPLPARPNFRFALSSDGSRLLVYGSGSTIEFYDAKTLKAIKMLYLNKDSTTNLVTMAGR